MSEKITVDVDLNEIDNEEAMAINFDVSVALKGKTGVDAILATNPKGIIAGYYLASITNDKKIPVNYISSEDIYRLDELLKTDTLLYSGLTEDELNRAKLKISSGVELLDIGRSIKDDHTLIDNNSKVRRQ